MWSGGLAEAEPRVDDQRLARTAEPDGPLDRPIEVGDDLGHEVRVVRLDAVVHEDHRAAALGGEPGQVVGGTDRPRCR